MCDEYLHQIDNSTQHAQPRVHNTSIATRCQPKPEDVSLPLGTIHLVLGPRDRFSTSRPGRLGTPRDAPRRSLGGPE